MHNAWLVAAWYVPFYRILISDFVNNLQNQCAENWHESWKKSCIDTLFNMRQKTICIDFLTR